MKIIVAKILTIVISIAVTLVLTSCLDEVEQQRITREQRRAAFVEDSLSLKVAVLPTEDGYGALVAEKLGLFDSVGVTVHLRHYNALSECRIALRKGMVEGAYIDSTLAKVVEQQDNTPLVLSKSTDLSWKLISYKLSRVQKVGQLVEKVVAADSHGDSHEFAEMAIDSVLRKQHNAFVVQCEDINVRYKMMAIGNVDAAMLPEPFASKAIKEGHKVIADYSSKKKGVIVFRKKAVDDKRIAAQSKLFLKAVSRANDSIRKNGVDVYLGK